MGSGFAKGIDVFLKYKYENKFTGWISYAYSDSKRRQYDATTQTSSDYDITHNMSFTGSYNVTDAINVGLSYRISTGKPYTPVVSSLFDAVAKCLYTDLRRKEQRQIPDIYTRRYKRSVYNIAYE
jgi:hypothetical protein